MKIDKNVIDDLNQTINITIEKSDYESKYKSELKKHAANAQIKGFRKGKTPISVVKKMYGQNVLVNVVNDSIQSSLDTFLKEEDLKILGQPIPSEEQADQPDFDPNHLRDYSFSFDIGLSPDFEIKGIGSKASYDIYDVQIDDELVQQEIDHITAQMGAQEHTDEVIEEKDIITVDAEELEGDNVKENGWATTFNVIVESLDDEYKDQLLKMKSGDEFTFDITKLEKDRKEDYVNKYLLNRTEADAEVEIGNDFKGKIGNVARLKKAEFNQELWDKYFGEGEVSSEEEAKEKIKENIKKYYDEQAKQVMYKSIMDTIVEDTKMELPKDFLKRWLKMNNAEATSEQIDSEIEGFLDNLRWTLIKSELTKKYEIKIEPEEMRTAMMNKVAGYFRQYGLDPSMADGVMNQMMQNQEEVNRVYEELSAEKVFNKIGEEVKKKEVVISKDDFVEVVKELNSKQQAS